MFIVAIAVFESALLQERNVICVDANEISLLKERG